MKKILFLLLIIIFFGKPLFAQTGSLACQKDPVSLAKELYQKFYPSYLRYASKPKPQVQDCKNLFKQKAYFSPELYAGFLKNEIRSLKANDLTGILDFDPFLNAQDDVGPARIGKASVSNGQTLVAVDFPEAPEMHIFLEMKCTGKEWQVSNFIYPGPHSSDLLNIFKDLDKEYEASKNLGPQK